MTVSSWRPYLTTLMTKKIVFFLLCCFTTAMGVAQKSDILLLQKHNRTIVSYFAGTYIQFLTTDRLPVNGYIDSLKRDSIFMTQFTIRQISTAIGATYTDTSGRYSLAFSIANIGYFPFKGRQPQVFWGKVLLLGGAGYTLVNTVNTLREGDALLGKNNLPRFLGGISAAVIGFLLIKTKKEDIAVGGKYQLKYLPQ